ncbi:MAG TPA: 16S rRNA (cytosine(1402)-N(4))-methyltransferase RsmH [Chitinispirillaceae bacterium]|nr:16S rRNA (cytosine(1402)-N(4))-methyltransferase RsmH [Chitinispirillaceae bacterium]
MDQNILIKKRRPRYPGTHPRSFEQKYKELNPEKYAQDIKKVFERGQTPAGMHIPICVDEILKVLNPQPGQTGLDATLGYGGHAEQLLKKITPGGRLFGIDVDPLTLPQTEMRLRKLGYADDMLSIKRMNFAGSIQLLSHTNGGFDFVLADLGVSSMQLDTPSRGFSFKLDVPLDLRMNPKHGQTATELIKNSSENELAELFINNSDEPYANILAHAISTQQQKIKSGRNLADIIKSTLSSRKISSEDITKSIQRIFQALRIAVNDEFGALEQFLKFLPGCLKSGGKVAILTFHSGEDRRVKKSFQANFRNTVFSDIAKTPLRPGPNERRNNPRSSCAKLRWAVKT